MKRLASALAAGCLLALVAVAAPAFSSGPWRPAPVDFELAPSSGAVTAAAGRAVVSRPLRAPKRFNLVGMRWRGGAAPGIAVRTRRTGGDWSRWTPLEAQTQDEPDPGTGEPEASGLSAPAWVGEADEVQVRLTRRVPGLRLHFVNVEGTATAADRARTAIRRATHAAVVSVAGLVGGTARAQSAQPGIVPRSAWGADKYCPPRAAPEYGEVKAAFVHHTVNPNDYTRAEAPDIVLGICRYHRNSNGWNDIGYNFLVDRFGTIYEGRAGGVDQPVMGAQAQGYNAQSTGIANIGTFSSVPQTGAALQAMANLIRWKLPLHGVPTYGATTLVSAGGSTNRYAAGRHVRVNRIAGHRDVDSTECPGSALYAQLAALRGLVGQVDASGLGTRLSARLSTRKARYRSRVRVAGRLRDVAGAPLPGRALAIERLYHRVWRPVARATTGATGSYRITVRPHASRRLRAHFLGDGKHHPSRSRSTVVRVRAVVSISHPATSAARHSRVPVRGTVKPRKRSVWLVLQQRRGGRNTKLGARRVRVRKGRFHTSFRPARTGLYRFYVVAKADHSTVRGSSRAHLVRVRRR